MRPVNSRARHRQATAAAIAAKQRPKLETTRPKPAPPAPVLRTNAKATTNTPTRALSAYHPVGGRFAVRVSVLAAIRRVSGPPRTAPRWAVVGPRSGPRGRP